MTGLTFPDISPIIFEFHGFALRWYSMAYLAGIVLAWMAVIRLNKKYNLNLEKPQIEDVVFYVTIGIILGGRLGYVIFYGGDIFWRNPLKILEIWHGGMSFHGGAAGAALGLLWAAKKRHIDFWLVADLAAMFAPIGIF
ncbi:MAG: prolipoprotein diacylglyceryl transferase, partial [Alphaproteobacteria bacterium]|nr:prolipoprotein diacylglyceryl transferase [Alphaproteobacteria bacterium]